MRIKHTFVSAYNVHLMYLKCALNIHRNKYNVHCNVHLNVPLNVHVEDI